MTIGFIMKIIQGIPSLQTNHKSRDCVHPSVSNPVSAEKLPSYSYPAVYFTAKFNPQKFIPSKIDLALSKENLIRQFDEILKNDVTEMEMTKEEIHLYKLNKANAYWESLANKALKLQQEANILTMVSDPSSHSAREQAQKIKREMNKIKRLSDSDVVIELPKVKVDPQYARMDFALINKFKSAVTDENFDLRRVYTDYYSGLNEVQTIRELKQRYPKIDIPKNPQEVVAKKIEGSLTRDFYEELDDIQKSGDKDRAKEFVAAKVNSVLEEQLKKSTPAEKTEINRKLFSTTVAYIGRRYRKLRDNDSFSTIPCLRKQNQQLITDRDKKLLTVDYNDFVLSVIREQYLGFKKPNEIVYSYNKGKPGNRVQKSIKIAELSNSEYKFSKMPEKIKTLINQGDEMKFTQRNYDYFSVEDFRKRLEFHADRQVPDERFLDILVNFNSCMFTPEDVDMLKKFLREADDALDGKKSVQDVVKYVERNNIRPSGTEKINEAERQKQIGIMKAEQKTVAELKHIQSKFDDRINLLYLNNMAYTAELCAPFRPAALDKEQNLKSDYIIKTIDKYRDKNDKNIILNKDRMATEITRWKKYLEYKKLYPESVGLKKAEEFATGKDGKIDYDKAGKYLINYDAVMNPKTFAFARNRSAADTIMNNLGKDTDKAVEYLCKYDDYLDMSDVEKSKISKILSIFDKKDELDKTLLKAIIEEEYTKVPTTDMAQLNESKKVKATIAPKAKQEILEYYHFPKCLEYFDAFEYALPQIATKRGTSGIKKLGPNFYELKITGHDDRLVAENGEYIFNKFDETGFH